MKKNSLTIKTVRTTVISCLLLGIIALLIGLSVYTTTMVSQYVRHAFETASHAQMSVRHGSDSISLARQTMEIYSSLTPRQKQKQQTDPEEYRSYYSAVDTSKGGTWDVLTNMLDTFVIDLDDVYLGMYDKETNALVYFVNADDDIVMYPGDWETVSETEVKKFLNWDGTGMLYHISHTEQYGWLCTAGYPIRGDSGELCEFLLVDVAVNNIASGIKDFCVSVTLGILVVTGLMAWYIRRRIRKTIAEPIDAIADAALAYTKGKKEDRSGEFFADLDISTGDELENLSHVLAGMEKDLAGHEEYIRAITAEKERIGTELSLAARIQKDVLPNASPAFPERTEFDVCGSMEPAKEVGGDFYDFFLIDGDHLGLVIADVSGKGVPAALLMMTAKIMVQNFAMAGRSPAEVLQEVNEQLCANNREEMFITVWFGILDIRTGEITAANAGHEYPVLMHPDLKFTLIKDKHGFVLGSMPGIKQREYTMKLTPGSKLFLYTDGVPEATSAEQELFGITRMLEALNRDTSVSPEETIRMVRRALDDFVKNAEQFDDITMLCLEYNGKKA